MNPSNPEVKPCPFCGTTYIHVVDGSGYRWRVAECTNCGARAGEVRVIRHEGYTAIQQETAAWIDAMKEWNERV